MTKRMGDRLQFAVAVTVGGLLTGGTLIHIVTHEKALTTPPPVATAPRPYPASLAGARRVSAVDPASPKHRGDPQLIWSDEFNGTGRPSPQKWTYQKGDRDGWGVGGLAYYDPALANEDGQGHLVITAIRNTLTQPTCWYGPCRYRSARIQSAGRFPLQYGTFAARIRFPAGQGIYPAFWLQRSRPGNPYAEIDIAEIFGARPNIIYGAAHQNVKVSNNTHTLKHPINSRFHIYRVDWTPTKITWRVGNHIYGTLKRKSPWPFNQPMQIILNLQTGGHWQGPPSPQTHFPAEMLVDWIRVYKSTSRPLPTK
ncbi:glycoside hydrolase family 16 protein [Acrocarpospora catenulata]|uniref:glycoside hydrolase family 16 protein n=1 Tax=Acrocarpospora catenulata TaxID=2836182 RepID=UPI001BDAB7F0|nr:glycoside hydrolase family 16 protein [Acrocarpospora catenulata]